MSIPHDSTPPCACVQCTYWRKGRDEERAAIVAHLRTNGIDLGAIKNARGDFAGSIVMFGAALLGGVAQGLADYFERGGHHEISPEGKAQAIHGVAEQMRKRGEG
jgi:hypothetical protein